MSQIDIEELEAWLRHTLSSKITQAEREREKVLGEVLKVIDALPEYCNQLSRKAEQDMEAKHENRAQYRAAKALSRLTTQVADMCKSVDIPKERDSTSLRTIQRELSKTASEAASLRSEYLRQIRPFYIIDMMTFGGNIDKLNRLSEDLHHFLMGRGVILKSLEEFDEKIRSLSKLRTTGDSICAQRKIVEEKLAETRRKGDLVRQQVNEIRQNHKMKEYVTIDGHLRELREELLRTGFSRLGRPLRRLASISERGDYALPIGIREATEEYLNRPFATFISEEEGYPKLKTVMSSLSSAVLTGKLSLKQREAKKVVDRSEQVISHNSLLSIQTQAKDLKQKYDKCLMDQETHSLVEKMKTLRQEGHLNRALERESEADLRRALESETRANDQIITLTKEIEEFSSKVTGVGVKIVSRH